VGFKLQERGFPTRHCYSDKQKAYKVAEQLARKKIAGEAAEKLAALSKKAGKGVGDDLSDSNKNTKGSGRLRGAVKGSVIAFVFTFFASAAFGSEDPLSDAAESLDPFSPGMLGYDEIDWTRQIEFDTKCSYNSWAEEQQTLNKMQKMRDGTYLDELARRTLQHNGVFISPNSRPTRNSHFPR
jgi:hypothetical protein